MMLQKYIYNLILILILKLLTYLLGLVSLSHNLQKPVAVSKLIILYTFTFVTKHQTIITLIR